MISVVSYFFLSILLGRQRIEILCHDIGIKQSYLSDTEPVRFSYQQAIFESIIRQVYRCMSTNNQGLNDAGEVWYLDMGACLVVSEVGFFVAKSCDLPHHFLLHFIDQAVQVCS